MAGRQRINEVVTGKVFQRGNMLTWPRELKNKMMAERNVGVVVNLWTRLDPDLTDAPIDWYLYIPIPPADTLTTKVMIGAKAVAEYLEAHPNKSALILCEAGVTRSALFAGVVSCMLAGMTGAEMYPYLAEAIPGLDWTKQLKDFFMQYKP